MSDLASRLLAKVVVQDNGCWMYTGGWNSGGYGNIWDNGRTRSAHIVSYEIHISPVPEGLNVLHSCDHKWCVNPEHLFVGTTQDNIDDMIAKGRDGFKGERNGRALLTKEQVLEVRAKLDAGFVQEALAAEFNVSRSTIAAIKSGRNWKLVA